MADEIENNNSLGTATILRGGLVSGSLANSSDIDYYRTGTGLGFGLDAPNGFTISSGDALSISFDSPTNLSNVDTVSISVLDEGGTLLSRVAGGRDFSFTTAVSANAHSSESLSGPYYIVVQDLSDQYGVFPTGNYGLTVNVIPGGALVGGDSN